jgi:hypothetical protein
MGGLVLGWNVVSVGQKMTLSMLPVSLCHANCPKCGLPTEFKMFESGPGGNFSTFVGVATGAIYRLDLGKVHYQKIPEASLLTEAEKREGRLNRVPEEIRCKICSTVFSARSIAVAGEEIIEAYEL